MSSRVFRSWVDVLVVAATAVTVASYIFTFHGTRFLPREHQDWYFTGAAALGTSVVIGGLLSFAMIVTAIVSYARGLEGKGWLAIACALANLFTLITLFIWLSMGSV